MALLFLQDFISEDVTFCGVFDGHGPHGHLVARKVREALPLKLLSFLHSSESGQNGSGKTCFRGTMKPESAESEKDVAAEENLNSMWREAFMKAYKAMDKELRSHPNLDCFCSGSTAVTVVKQVYQLAESIFKFPFHFADLLFSLLSRVQICSWAILGIPEQSWDPRTAMMSWWQLS